MYRNYNSQIKGQEVLNKNKKTKIFFFPPNFQLFLSVSSINFHLTAISKVCLLVSSLEKMVNQ